MTDKTTVLSFFEESEVFDILHLAQSNASTSWEQDFMQQQISRYQTYQGRMLLSEKQANVIRKLARIEP